MHYIYMRAHGLCYGVWEGKWIQASYFQYVLADYTAILLKQDTSNNLIVHTEDKIIALLDMLCTEESPISDDFALKEKKKTQTLRWNIWEKCIEIKTQYE